jgi:hypothetical protein
MYIFIRPHSNFYLDRPFSVNSTSLRPDCKTIFIDRSIETYMCFFSKNLVQMFFWRTAWYRRTRRDGRVTMRRPGPPLWTGFGGRAAHLMHCFQPTLSSGISPLSSAPACAAVAVYIYKSHSNPTVTVLFLRSPELNIG